MATLKDEHFQKKIKSAVHQRVREKNTTIEKTKKPLSKTGAFSDKSDSVDVTVLNIGREVLPSKNKEPDQQVRKPEKTKRVAKKQRKPNERRIKVRPITVKRTTADAIPYVELEDNHRLKMRGQVDTYSTIVQINTDDHFVKNNDDLWLYLQAQTNFYRVYSGDIKIIGMRYPVITKTQVKHLIAKQEQTEDPLMIQLLDEEIDQCRAIEQTKTVKEFFMVLYGSSIIELEKNVRTAYQLAGHLPGLIEMSDEKIIAVLNKLNNIEKKILIN
ncbi:hypothetical protein I0652_000681 [Listeria monocytogenes]|nr:hypothetical protein [Listeria monocytogenes]